MKESIAKESFEAWWSVNYSGLGRDKWLAWIAFKKGVKVAEAYNKEK